MKNMEITKDELKKWSQMITIGKDRKKLNVVFEPENKKVKMIKCVQKEEGDDENPCVKITGNLFDYEGNSIHIILEDDKPWFRGKDVA